MNKKGQLDFPIVTFIVLVVGLIIFAPIMLKFFITFSSSMSHSLGNVSGEGGIIAQANFNKVTNTLITMWDKVILFAFILSIILLFVSAFMIDSHPFFLILYILLGFFLVIFTPNLISAVDHIYDSPQYATEVTYLTFLDNLRTNFGIFLVGIFIITGIIIYGKLAFFRSQSGVTR